MTQHTETATPRTDAEKDRIGAWPNFADSYATMLLFARQLEREFAALQAHCDRLTGMRFSERMHAALVSRAETAEAERDTLRTQLAQAQNEAMKKAVRIMEKHKKKQSSGRCCDNCNCVAMCHGLNELRGLSPNSAEGEDDTHIYGGGSDPYSRK